MSRKITEKTAISVLNSARPRKGSYDRLQVAFEMAVKALEKQIPKTTKESILGVYCSECKHFLDGTEYYCSFCGQKIDWSVDNEEH